MPHLQKTKSRRLRACGLNLERAYLPIARRITTRQNRDEAANGDANDDVPGQPNKHDVPSLRNWRDYNGRRRARQAQT
jgi:hypothetical protein